MGCIKFWSVSIDANVMVDMTDAQPCIRILVAYSKIIPTKTSPTQIFMTRRPLPLWPVQYIDWLSFGNPIPTCLSRKSHA